ncbi:MAG: energy-coupling factor transporter ATPase [Slackia sp.]
MANTQQNVAPLIEFDHVSHTYLDASRAKKNRSKKHDKQAKWGSDPNAVWALHDATFSIAKGEFVGIAGHTGSGKSTLIQHMNGILKPTCGRVLVEGKDIADKKEANVARSKVGVVFQYPERQLFAATVYDDVAFGPRNMGLDEHEIDVRVRKSLARVDLDFEALKDASPFELSGGQQRRVAFAGVLAMRPSVLVLDEPTAGLDPAARRDFLALISSLHKEMGLTVIMVSHSMDDLAAFCQKLIVLKEGETFAMGAPETVFLQEKELEAIGLGVPAAQRMASKLRERGVPMPDCTLYTIDSLVEILAPTLSEKTACSKAGKEGVR